MAFLERCHLAETMAIFPGKFIHVGGDEVVASGDTQWNSYSADVTNYEAIYGIAPSGTASIVKYQYWLSTNLSSFIQAHGHMMIGWTETENGATVIPNAGVMDWQTGSSSKAVAVAEAGLPVVMAPDADCYINYVEGTSSSLPIEPPFVVGGTPSYLSDETSRADLGRAVLEGVAFAFADGVQALRDAGGAPARSPSSAEVLAACSGLGFLPVCSVKRC